MILLDSQAFYKQVKMDWSEKLYRGMVTAQATLEIVWKDLEVAATPYRATANAFYEEHGKEIVDTKILPFYHEQVRPLYIQYIVPLLTLMKEKFIIPSIVKLEQGLEILQEKWIIASQEMFACACKTMETQAGTLKKFLVSKDLHSNGANFVFEFLANVEKDASTFVTVLGYIVAFMILYRFKYHILSFIWFVLIVLPFRVVWFFCPLRLLTKRKLNVQIEEKDDDIEGITSLISNEDQEPKVGKEVETSNGEGLPQEEVKKKESNETKDVKKEEAVLYMPETKGEEGTLEDEDSDDAKVTNGETTK